MRLAVLGSPIAHSKSPALHRAAYAALGLDWSYQAIEVTADALPGFVGTLGAEWRGLSLTMPLKREVLPLLDTMDEFTELTGAANTVLFDDARRRRGFNTDVHGVIQSFRDAGVTGLHSVRILGGGATAASVMVAVSRLGASRVAIAARSAERLGTLVALGERLDLQLTIETLGALEAAAEPDALVSTLPGGTELGFAIPPRGILFDVAYDPWPSRLASGWLAAGAPVIGGLELLAHQALAQVRIFVNGTPGASLAGEADVFAAMRAAVGLAT